MRDRAKRQAEAALRTQQDKTRAFDEQARKAAGKAAFNQEDSMYIGVHGL